MGLVPRDWTADAAAELALAVVTFHRVAGAVDLRQFLGFGERVHRLVAEELERAAVDVVGTALGDDRQDAAVAAAVLGLEALRLEVELLDRLERERLQLPADGVVVVVAAVDQIVDAAP